ncbi:MAG: trypsin-like peptidase domain-containing protein [Porticoccaceae bacterium]|jgi:V8-like Glu-specific endopeptidase|nr:trypsin-like peptidase domain-containing protein [Porticoccaceae bacterium]MDG1306622.1 trypsin-like peptidase domain-containing protein [Porticoccaceae bacterium]
MIRHSLLIFVFLFTGMAHSAIFGDGNPDNGMEDQRENAPKNLLNSVGTIFCDGGLRGTATHIKTALQQNRSIILTAAHVLFDQKTGMSFKQCSYRPENQRLSSIEFSSISTHQYKPESKNKIQQSETDIVFVALKKRAYQRSLELAQSKNTVANSLQLLGYNADSQKISLSSDCTSFESDSFISDQLLLHNCDALSGASGGPIITATEQGDNAVVIAVHGGTLVSAGASIRSLATGAQVNPEQWINQARIVDKALLNQLELFLAYLAKDFPSQK